mmetsp:Transcript_10334/g.36414  ORF Transcript_10334/g.36414 Transcript_10334/m.36414 type:complete len:307 (+) Transcript_10334:1782-2702(+)
MFRILPFPAVDPRVGPAFAGGLESIAVVGLLPIKVAHQDRRDAAVPLRLGGKQLRGLRQLRIAVAEHFRLLVAAHEGLEVRRTEDDISHASPVRAADEQAAAHERRRVRLRADAAERAERFPRREAAKVRRVRLLPRERPKAGAAQRRRQEPVRLVREFLQSDDRGAGLVDDARNGRHPVRKRLRVLEPDVVRQRLDRRRRFVGCRLRVAKLRRLEFADRRELLHDAARRRQSTLRRRRGGGFPAGRVGVGFVLLRAEAADRGEVVRRGRVVGEEGVGGALNGAVDREELSRGGGGAPGEGREAGR